MIFNENKKPGMSVIELERQRDERGFFAKQWCSDEFTRAGRQAVDAQYAARFAESNAAEAFRWNLWRCGAINSVPHPR